MDENLRKAVSLLLNKIQETDVVRDLLLLELDWENHTPDFMAEPDTIRFQNQEWSLIFTDSELIMRRTLCQADQHQADQGQAILILQATANVSLPDDIQARAYRGTTIRLGMQHLLYAHSGRDWPAEVGYSEWQPTIKNRFDTLVQDAAKLGLNYAVSRNDLEQMLVEAAFGLAVKGKEAPQLLADLVSFQNRVSTQPTELELSLFAGQLRAHEVGSADTLIWVAEEPGRAEGVVQTGLMLAAEKAANYQPNWGNLNSLRGLLVNKRGLSDTQAIDLIIKLATDTLPHVHPSTRSRIVQTAERELQAVLPDTAYNPWFRQQLAAECLRLARTLSHRNMEAVGRIAVLQEHLFASQQASMIETLDNMAALVRHWHEQADVKASLATVTDWAKWYANKGSLLDLLALRLTHALQRGEGDKESIERLLNQYWPWHNALNKAFAEQFVATYETAIHDKANSVFGTHRIIEWVVRPLRQQQKRVLLLVLDGMSYPDFRELMEQWAGARTPIYADERFVALSLLPSVTSVSRKALFLNALPTDPLDDEEIYSQKAQTREKDGLSSALPHDSISFYFKGNLNGGHELRQDIEFLKHDVVAAIFNAIDDGLTSTTTTVRLYKPDDIGALATIANAALEKGWSVLLTADHGHTWFRDKSLRQGAMPADGGARFAPVTDEADLPPDGVVTADPHILQVHTGSKVMFLTATGTYYGHMPRRGFHGGASLEEVVIPCALLTYEKQATPKTAPATETAADQRQETAVAASEGVILKFRDGRVVDLSLPLALNAKETRLLQSLAWLNEASEAELKKAVGSRRVAGPMAALREKLAAAGPQYDYIEQIGTGAEGARYRFRTELLS